MTPSVGLSAACMSSIEVEELLTQEIINDQQKQQSNNMTSRIERETTNTNKFMKHISTCKIIKHQKI